MIEREYEESGELKRVTVECDCGGCDTEVLVLKAGEPIPKGWVRPSSSMSEKALGKCFCSEGCYHKFLASGKKEGRPKGEKKVEKENKGEEKVEENGEEKGE